MKVILTAGPRRGLTVDLPDVDAKKLIKKGHAKSAEKKSETKKTAKTKK